MNLFVGIVEKMKGKNFISEFVNKTDKNGVSLIHIATIRSQIQIIHFLIENGASINIVDKLGNTPLHYLLSQITLLSSILKQLKLQSKAATKNVGFGAFGGHGAAFGGGALLPQINDKELLLKNQVQIFESLINFGADCSIQNNKKRKCNLHYL